MRLKYLHSFSMLRKNVSHGFYRFDTYFQFYKCLENTPIPRLWLPFNEFVVFKICSYGLNKYDIRIEFLNFIYTNIVIPMSSDFVLNLKR